TRLEPTMPIRLPFCLLTALLLVVQAAPAAPGRLVSLDLCLDWMVAHYVPRTHVAALPPMQKRYPIDWVGSHWPTHDGSLEQIYALQPDRVVVGQFTNTQLRQRLQALGLPVEVLPLPTTLAQVTAYERQFLRAVKRPESL